MLISQFRKLIIKKKILFLIFLDMIVLIIMKYKVLKALQFPVSILKGEADMKKILILEKLNNIQLIY